MCMHIRCAHSCTVIQLAYYMYMSGVSQYTFICSYKTTLSQTAALHVGRLNQTCSESLVAGHFKRTVNTLVWPFKAVMMSGVCSRRFLELGSAPALRRTLAISGFSLREGRERMVNFTPTRLLHRLSVSIIAMVILCEALEYIYILTKTEDSSTHRQTCQTHTIIINLE